MTFCDKTETIREPVTIGQVSGDFLRLS